MNKEMYWAVGLFEGAGSIITNKYGRSKFGHINLIIQLSDKDILKRFHKIVKVGNFRGPYNNKGPNSNKGQQYKQVWCWSCGTSAEVIKLLITWLPLLGNRRRAKAKIAIMQAKKSIAWMRQRNRCCKNGHNWSHYAQVQSNGTRRCKLCYDNWRKARLERNKATCDTR